MNDLNPDTMNALIERIHGCFAGAATTLMVHLGDRLGLYRTLTDHGPTTPSELAEHTGYSERYLTEWLAQQAVARFLTYDSETGRFALPPEHAMLLAKEETPTTFAGGFEALVGLYLSVNQVTDVFRTGEGLSWGDHDQRVHQGAARFFGASYRQNLVDDWVPALGLVDRLQQGVLVADVGCGEGVTTTLLAAAYPASRFVGIDVHAPSIETATKRASDAGVAGRTRFVIDEATSYGGGPYDVIWFFDSIHDLADPVSAAANARKHLTDDGLVALVEPYAADDMAENIATNPAAALHYTASAFLCVPNSLDHPGGAALGGQAGGRRLADVMAKGGLSNTARVATTPQHAVYAARP